MLWPRRGTTSSFSNSKADDFTTSSTRYGIPVARLDQRYRLGRQRDGRRYSRHRRLRDGSAPTPFRGSSPCPRTEALIFFERDGVLEHRATSGVEGRLRFAQP